MANGASKDACASRLFSFQRSLHTVLTCLFGLAILLVPAAQSSSITIPEELQKHGKGDFDFQRETEVNPPTLEAWFQAFEPASGRVVVSGVDLSRPARPFTFEWGDGEQSKGEWPQEHTYARRDRNYVICITSNRPRLGPTQVELPVRFAAPAIRKAKLPQGLQVRILDRPDLKLTSHARGHNPPPQLDFFGDACFSTIPRDPLEYVLHAAACIQYDLLNRNVFLPEGEFRQILFRDAKFQGMYSLWFTTPVSFGVGDYGFKPPIQYSSFFHEMGHNFNLNSPATFAYGGRATGNASDIYTETLAQILQHVTAYILINNRDYVGLDDFTAREVVISARFSMRWLRRFHEEWVAGGMKYASWNDPATKENETFGTFMTVAYKFLEHVEKAGKGYRSPVKRMMFLLQQFNRDCRARYGQRENTPDAEKFRATLMVAAASYGLSADLRNEFRKMHFPVDDTAYKELIAVPEISGEDQKAAPVTEEAVIIQPDANGVIKLGADDAELHGDQIQQESRGGQSNIGFWDKADEWVSWKLRCEKAGSYSVSAEAAALGASEFVVQAGAQSLHGTAPATGGWDKFQSVAVGTLEIKQAGVVEVKVRPKDAASWKAINLRAVKLTPQ